MDVGTAWTFKPDPFAGGCFVVFRQIKDGAVGECIPANKHTARAIAALYLNRPEGPDSDDWGY